jgi:sporulation protein YlmC with PRC-barrel domain
MAHYGNLGNKHLDEDVHDIRGTVIRGSDGKELGKVNDVIFDHATMEIRYVVVGGNGLGAKTFVLPADRLYGDVNHPDDFASTMTIEKIENSPQYDKNSSRSSSGDEWNKDEWKKYEQEFKQYWEEKPVMHMKDSDRVLVPPVAPERGSSIGHEGGGISESPDIARLFPERIAGVFPDPAPGAGKVTLRPKSAVRVEEAASGVTMMKPHWWESFENYLRENKSDIQSNCPECKSKAA